MSTTFIIAKRELRSYFDGLVAYIVITSFLLIAGWMTFSPFFLVGRADMRSFFAPSPFSPSMLLVIIVPAVTMRLIAEERRSGTIELLTTLPITDTAVVIGKFLGAAGMILTALFSTVVYAFVINLMGDLDLGAVFAGYVGLALFAMTLVAIGVLMSTLTDNQIVAFILSFIVSAVLYFVFWLLFFMPESLAQAFEYITVSYHLDNMARGVIDSRDVIYYSSLIGGALYLSVQSLKRRHA